MSATDTLKQLAHECIESLDKLNEAFVTSYESDREGFDMSTEHEAVYNALCVCKRIANGPAVPMKKGAA